MAQTRFDFRGSKVLVTGASSGIGLATATEFVAAGADVMLSGLVQEGTDAALSSLQEGAQGKVLFTPADVRDESQVEDLIRTTVEQLGGLTIAVNNAGTEGVFGPIQSMESEEFDRLISVNLKGAWLSMKHEIPQMEKGGVIINMASTAGIQAIPMVAVYSATKHGIIGLTKGAALELAEQGIRVNAVAPGPVDTGLLSRMVADQVPLEIIAESVPLKRIADPKEIASAVLWLASDGSSYVTGETLMVDGGVIQT